MNISKKKELEKILGKAIEIIKDADEKEIFEINGSNFFQKIVEAFAPPIKDQGKDIYEYLFENKNRLQAASRLRLFIQRNYSLKGKVEDIDVFVSPCHLQWYENGVMFLQGEKPFEGLMGLYQNGKVKFGICKRDIPRGENVCPDNIEFVAIEEMEERQRQPSVPTSFDKLESVIVTLEELLKDNNNNESLYQEYCTSNPWIFGAQYKMIQSHVCFNDENIPDFTGVRVKDSSRDIIEIKPPFLPIFTKQNQFRSDFNDSWNQVERYLDFARHEQDYLNRQKGMYFDNPKCYLLAGYNLSSIQLKEIRRKERMNPAINIITYNDLLVMIRSTIDFFKSLKR